MPITFDEVTADIDREPAGGSIAPAPAAAPVPDPREQIERELRIMAERQARLWAD